jgi:hypothetical protein
MRPIVARHVVLASLPLVLGLAAGWGFAWQQETCGHLVGPLFAAKCGRIQVEYQLWFQTAGTALGALLAATIGIWLERRRARRPPSPPPVP